nr:rhombotarget lipoprotein [uncultured Undibacterium sp.]
MKTFKFLSGLAVVLFTLFSLNGCASMAGPRESKQSASIVDYLYPKATQTPQLTPGITYLRPPVRVGIAFAPNDARARTLPETEKIKLMERIKTAFAGQAFIGSLDIIPSQYLQPAGGFVNMEQVARMFNVDVMAMVSYDQIQFTDSNSLSFLYWTVIGAYVVHGNEYDTQTMLDISVFDVTSRKLLMRAPGTSQVKGGANLSNFSERSRAARTEGYNKAADQSIPALQAEIESFRERLKTNDNMRVEPRPGYRVGGSPE